MPREAKNKFKPHKSATAPNTTENKYLHVHYKLQADGSLSTSRSTLNTIKKSKKKDQESPTEEIVAPIVEDGLSGTLEEPPVDKAYLEHVEETTLDDKDKAKRVRPKGVRAQSGQNFANTHLR